MSGWIWFVIIAYSFVCGIIACSMADEKGYSGGAGFAAGFFFNIFGIIIYACQPDLKFQQDLLSSVKSLDRKISALMKENASATGAGSGDSNNCFLSNDSWVSPVKHTISHIICPACGTVQHADRKICFHCGAPLSETTPKSEENPDQGFIRCPVCETANRVDLATCYNCGAKLPHTNSEAKPTPRSSTASVQADAAPITLIQTESANKIQCPACGTVQRADRRVCFHCGVPFKKER